MKIKEIPGATPLDEEAVAALIPGLTTQTELDEFEAANIARAILWASSSRKLKSELLSATGLKLLHRKMFEDTWQWAGEFRKRQTNIGVAPAKIQNDLGILLGDVQYWLEHETFAIEEIAVRFHHRLVLIHPFTNGNGRFSRLATDLFLSYHGGVSFGWGKSNLARLGEIRSEYIRCLKLADAEENYQPLLKFVKGS